MNRTPSLLLTMLCPLTGVSFAETGNGREVEEQPASFTRAFQWSSGTHDGGTGEFEVVAQTIVSEADATCVRVHFGNYSLGARSFVRVRSIQDGSSQDLDAETMGYWYDYSGFAAGDALTLELHVARGEQRIFVEVDRMMAGNPLYVDRTVRDRWEDPNEDTLCGSDNRVASGETRVGRVRRLDNVTICSPWLACNGAVVMAGHCFDNDNNGSNELITAGSVVEFNPPASNPNGTTNASLLQNQYPIDMTRLNWSPLWTKGADWGVFGINPNTANGDRAHGTRGFYRMTRENPAQGSLIRITSCGTDITPAGSGGGLNAQNRTVQTASGPYEDSASSSAQYWHEYKVDTTGGSSGAPIHWVANGVAVGIHTTGGCDSSGGGENSGTSFEHDPLEAALRNFIGSNAVFVDAGMPGLGVVEDGTVLRPMDRVEEGVAIVPSGGIVSIVEGTYDPAKNGSYVIKKPLRLIAPVGSAILGD